MSEEHQCGGPQEACCIPGCPECGATDRDQEHVALRTEIKELQADVAFLRERAAMCGAFVGDASRSWGISANWLVNLAYGFPPPPDGYPRDRSDLAACDRAYDQLPEHRKTMEVLTKLIEWRGRLL